MRVLLTGATGLLGAHLLKQGLDQGVDFLCLGRSISKRSYLAQCQDQVRFVSIDLTDEKKIKELDEEVDLVIHAAALASPFQKDDEAMEELNVKGTKNLYQKFGNSCSWVQVSSVATMSNGSNQIINESNFGSYRETTYARTKIETDKWLESQSSNILFIHPCYMLGEWDARPSSGSIFLGLKLNKFKYYLNGQKNFVAAEDVARGIWQAIDKKAKGRFLLGHINSDLEDFFSLACEKLKLDSVPKCIDLNSENTISEEGQRFMKEFCLSNAVDYQKASSQFGYSPIIGLEEMIDKTLSYFQEKKLLRIR